MTQAHFTVWSQGGEVDLDEYIAYCASFPDCSYYVNLDVIPGKIGEKKSLTKESIEDSCRRGWINYRRMIKSLPKDKVIPVFHQNDDPKWLRRYMDFGCEYIGISPANDESTAGKLKWLRTLRPILFDGAGRPTVKTHGFAVTSFRMMKAMEWHSVDSASWKMTATYGFISQPKHRGGAFDYSTDPLVVGITPQCTQRRHQMHYQSLTPMLKEKVHEFLDSCGLKLGRSKQVQVGDDYKLDISAGDIWFSKKKRILLKVLEQGVENSFEHRAILCAKFMARANLALKDTVKHLYLAGLPMPYSLEYQIRLRLLSYYYCQQPSMRAYIQHHCDLIREGK